MSERHLTEASWKTFAKGKGWKDDALLKALAAQARAEKAPEPAERIAAVDALAAEFAKLGKANPKEKELAAYVAEAAKAAQREKAAAQKEWAEREARQTKEAKEAKEAQAKAKAAADAAPGPALLGPKLLGFLRSVQGNDKLRLPAMVALAGKRAAAVVDRSSIGGSHRTMLQQHLGGSGIKFIPGDLCWEAKALTFVLESSAGGPLATKLKLGLFEQTGQKLKIRVRTADSKDAEESADDDDATGAAPSSAPPAAGDRTDKPAARLIAQLEPLFDEMAKPGSPLPPDLAEPAAQAQRAFRMALELVEQGNDERALVILKKLAEGGLLARLRAARAAPAAAPPGAMGKPSLVEQRQFMLTRWKRVPLDLRAEVDALRKSVADDAGAGQADAVAAGVKRYLDDLLEQVQARLDTAVGTGNTAAIAGIRDAVESDPMLKHLASSPLGDGTRFRRAVVDAIAEIEARIGG
jgi:hypothetical protein